MPGARVQVSFLVPWGPYGNGDRASVSPQLAAALVDQGKAAYAS